MIAMTHFALGAAIGMGVLGPFVSDRWRPAVMVASGLWAMVPDVDHFFNGPGGFFHNHELWSNVFWLHTTLDALKTGHPHVEAATALAFLAFTTAFVTLKAKQLKG